MGSSPADIDRLIDRADLDGLLIAAGDLIDAGRWDDARELRDRCRAAVETGRQLWPVASHIAYRAVLHGPRELAVLVLEHDSDSFALGPFPEVAATRPDGAAVHDELSIGSVRTALAHELATLGVPIAGHHVDDRGVPPVRARWEPTYSTPEYKAYEVVDPPPRLGRIPISADLLPRERSSSERSAAFDGLFEHWVTRSEGRVEAVTTAGRAEDAIRALGPSRVGMEPLATDQALRWLHWAGGCGGAWGRRRGGGAARFELWWTLASIVGLDDDWPLDPDELGAAVGQLEFVRWDAGEPAVGWNVRLAVHDPVDDLSWALAATDAR